MATDAVQCHPVLTREQLDCTSRPRNVAEERRIIAAAKVDLTLLAMLSAGTISQLLPGEKDGAFWVTRHYRIVAEPHQLTLGSVPELIEFCNKMKDDARERLDMIPREEKARKSITSPGDETGGQYPGSFAIQPANPAELELSLCHEQCSVAANLRNSLRNARIDYRFGLVLDNTGTTDCTCCVVTLRRIVNGCGCNQTQCPNFNNLAILSGAHFASTKIIDVYARQEGIQVSDAVVSLCDKLGILVDEPFSEPPSVERSMIIRTKTTNMLPFVPSTTMASSGKDGGLAGGIRVQPNQDGTKSIIPYTPASWKTGGWEAWLSIPPCKPYSLLNWPLASSKGRSPVLLTDCIDFVAYTLEHDVADMLPGVWVSWYGGTDTVADVNWGVLKGRKVFYALFCHSGLSMQATYETALRVYFRLLDVEEVDLTFLRSASIPPCVPDPEMTPDEFMASAKDMGLAELVVRLGNERRARSGMPVRFSEIDTSEEPEHFLLSPVIRKGETCILYGMKETGKTALTLRMAFAVSLGSPFLKPWGRQSPRKVLYLEGEAGDVGIRPRIRSARETFNDSDDHDALIWFNYERMNLYSDEGRLRVDNVVCAIERDEPTGVQFGLLVIDNLTSMNGGDDDPTQWDTFHSWLMTKFKSRGVSVLIVHHANRNAGMMGTQMKRINADRTIYVESIPERESFDATGRLRLRLDFENVRNNAFPEARTPMEIEYSHRKNKWTMLGSDGYISHVLENQIKADYTDATMGVFWDLNKDQVKALRMKYGMRKYNVDDGSPSVTGELMLLP